MRELLWTPRKTPPQWLRPRTCCCCCWWWWWWWWWSNDNRGLHGLASISSYYRMQGRNFYLKSGRGYKNSTCGRHRRGVRKFLKFYIQNGTFSAIFGNENRWKWLKMHYSAQEISKIIPCVSEKWAYCTPLQKLRGYPPYPPHSTPMIGRSFRNHSPLEKLNVLPRHLFFDFSWLVFFNMIRV